MGQIPGRLTAEKRQELSADFKEAIDAVDAYVHALFDPEYMYRWKYSNS